MTNELRDHIQAIVDNAPGKDKTDRMKYVAKNLGCGRTHLYEMLAGHHELNSLTVAKNLRIFGVPAQVILP